jgi:hypothetical protein
MTKELIALLDGRETGRVVRNNRGKLIFTHSEQWRNAAMPNLHLALLALKQPRAGFHCFWRFRESVLQMSDARNLLIDYWMGHENRDMGAR